MVTTFALSPETYAVVCTASKRRSRIPTVMDGPFNRLHTVALCLPIFPRTYNKCIAFSLR